MGSSHHTRPASQQRDSLTYKRPGLQGSQPVTATVMPTVLKAPVSGPKSGYSSEELDLRKEKDPANTRCREEGARRGQASAQRLSLHKDQPCADPREPPARAWQTCNIQAGGDVPNNPSTAVPWEFQRENKVDYTEGCLLLHFSLSSYSTQLLPLASSPILSRPVCPLDLFPAGKPFSLSYFAGTHMQVTTTHPFAGLC